MPEKKWWLVGKSLDLVVCEWWVCQPKADMQLAFRPVEPVMRKQQGPHSKDWQVYCTEEELRAARVAHKVVHEGQRVVYYGDLRIPNGTGEPTL